MRTTETNTAENEKKKNSLRAWPLNAQALGLSLTFEGEGGYG